MHLFKSSFLLIICLLFYSCASSLHDSEPTTSLRFEHSIPVEVQLSNSNSRMFIDGEVDGENEHFVFDTGAFETEVANSDFFKKYPVNHDKRVHGLYSTDNLSEILVNTVTAHGVAFPLHKILRNNSTNSRDGLLGIDALKDRVVVLDFYHPNHARLSLEDKFPPEFVPSPLRLASAGHLIIDAMIEGEPVPALFDTGASQTLIDPSLVKKFPTLRWVFDLKNRIWTVW